MGRKRREFSSSFKANVEVTRRWRSLRASTGSTRTRSARGRSSSSWGRRGCSRMGVSGRLRGRRGVVRADWPSWWISLPQCGSMRPRQSPKSRRRKRMVLLVETATAHDASPPRVSRGDGRPGPPPALLRQRRRPGFAL